MKMLTNKHTRTMFCAVLSCIALFVIISVILMSLRADDAALYIFLCAVVMAAAVLTILYLYIRGQEKLISAAAGRINEYMTGNKDARIDCDMEGELYKLFHKINSLAAVLNAHAENELRSKDTLKNTISDISHQLKTPLAALNIYNGLLQNGAEDMREVREFAELSEQELDRIEALVQKLLKITKLDSGAVSMDRTMENVSDMMENVRKHFLFRAEQEGKEISLAGSDDVELLCDRGWLIEAIDNIVTNALDHTSGGGRIDIEWRQSMSVVRIIIKDNGSGIHPEDLHHIFKRFYRSRFSKDTNGIGLGLPLAKAVIEAHSGSIEVDSELGRGTAFIINFLIPTKL